MKKIIMLMLGILSFFFSKNVLANSIEKLTIDYENTPYYYRSFDNYSDYQRLAFYNLNGEVAYCVEPGIHITSDTYVSISENNLSIDNSVLEKIKLIGYYGYEYPSHSTINYRIATQSLIWKTIKNMSITFYAFKNNPDSVVDYINEENEIMKLVNNHYIVPSFENDLTLSIYKDNILIDNNNVLSNFEIINNNTNLIVFKDDNKLHIKSNEIGDYQITLKKIKYDNKSSILFGGIDLVSQKLMKLRYDNDVYLTLNIHIRGGKIFLHKVNNDNQDNKSIGFSTLKGAKYQIFDEFDNLVSELITNEFGESESGYLAFGNYYLKEFTPSYGYLIDKNIYKFSISSDSLNEEIISYENLIKKNVTIIKTKEGDLSLLSGEDNIDFEIYLNNKLYDTITTNSQGVAKINLPYGKYLFHQINTTEGYLKSEDFEILIDENTDEVVNVIYDKRVRGSLSIIKKDLDKEIRLKDALIEVYKDNELIYSGYTNSQGEIEINDLFVGEYVIIEKEAPKDYILNNEEYIIHITNSNPDVLLEIKNKHVEIEVPSTGLDYSKKLKYSCIGIILIGFIFILFGRKKQLIS